MSDGVQGGKPEAVGEEKPENNNYFRGAENTDRVRQRRKANPGYRRKKKPDPAEVQQIEVSTTQGQPVRYPLLNLPHFLGEIIPNLPVLRV